MSKFVAYYNLCPIHDTKEFLGLSPDRDDGNVITTLGHNMVVVFKIITQKQIRSWSVLEKLSSKVIFDSKSQQYVGVFANRYLRCWDENITDVNKCKKLKFQKNIIELVCDDNDTLVLYSDGSCESLDSAIQSRKEQTPSDTLQVEVDHILKITHAKIITLLDGRKILTYFRKYLDNGTVDLIKVNLNNNLDLKSIGNEIKYNLKRGCQDVAVAGYAVIEGQNSPMLLTIWSDKRFFLLNLADNISPETSPGNFVSMINHLKVDNPLSILGISKHCVAIYGANSTQEGASLLLYNTQFKVIKAKQFFKIYFNFSRLWSVGCHILLAMGQNLSVVSYRMAKELLSDLVGSQISNEFQKPVEGDYINEEYPLEECLQFNSTRPDAVHQTRIGKNTPVFIADGKNIPFESVNVFDNDIQLMSKSNMHVEILQLEKSNVDEDLQINLMSNYNDNGFMSKEVEQIALQMEICGASEQEITEKLLLALIRSDLVQDVAICLRRYTNISEKMLAKTLKYVLSGLQVIKMDNAVLSTNLEHMDVEVNIEEPKGDINDFPNLDLFAEKCQKKVEIKDKIELLNVVLSCSFDNDAVAIHIRKEIDYKQVLVILEHIYNLLTCAAQCTEERPESVNDDMDFELKMFRWFGIFLNTHFQKLALSKDSNLVEILFKWHELFILYKKQIADLEQVSALMYNIIQKKKISKEKNYSKWYSIEEVRLY